MDDALVEGCGGFTPHRMLGEVINPFPSNSRHCRLTLRRRAGGGVLQLSRGERSPDDKIKQLFQSLPTPVSPRLRLSLYHCLSEVEDVELNRSATPWGRGWSALDGREMLREARQRRKRLQDELRRWRTQVKALALLGFSC